MKGEKGMNIQEYIKRNQAEFDNLEKIEEYRQTLTLEQQADFIKSLYPGISDEMKRAYFMCFVKSWRWQRDHSFTVINGGK